VISAELLQAAAVDAQEAFLAYPPQIVPSIRPDAGKAVEY
jgi:hypothetical protein